MRMNLEPELAVIVTFVFFVFETTVRLTTEVTVMSAIEDGIRRVADREGLRQYLVDGQMGIVQWTERSDESPKHRQESYEGGSLVVDEEVLEQLGGILVLVLQLQPVAEHANGRSQDTDSQQSVWIVVVAEEQVPEGC